MVVIISLTKFQILGEIQKRKYQLSVIKIQNQLLQMHRQLLQDHQRARSDFTITKHLILVIQS